MRQSSDSWKSAYHRMSTITTSASFLLTMPSIRQFSDEYDFAMESGWDGRPDTPALSADVLLLSEKIIEKYAGLEHIVEVAPGRDGSLSFTWDDKKGNYVYMDFGPKDTIHLYYKVKMKQEWEGVSVDSDIRIHNRIKIAFEFMRPHIENEPVFIVFSRSPTLGNDFFRSIAA